jgi:hypothetical protein
MWRRVGSASIVRARLQYYSADVIVRQTEAGVGSTGFLAPARYGMDSGERIAYQQYDGEGHA